MEEQTTRKRIFNALIYFVVAIYGFMSIYLMIKSVGDSDVKEFFTALLYFFAVVFVFMVRISSFDKVLDTIEVFFRGLGERLSFVSKGFNWVGNAILWLLSIVFSIAILYALGMALINYPVITLLVIIIIILIYK